MKKRLAVLLFAGAMATALTACGEKTPTLEDIQAGMSDANYTTMEGDGKLSLSADLELDNIGEETQQVLDMLSGMYGVDLSKKQDASIDMSFDMEGEKQDDVSHLVVNYDMKIDSSVDALLEQLDATSQKATREQYTDGDTKYYTDDDGDTWYYEDDDNDNGAENGSAIINLFVSMNEKADDANKIQVVATEDGRYLIAVEGVVNQEYAESLSKEDKDELQDIFDENDIDVDLDDLWDMYDDYGDYVDVEIPFSLSVYYINTGDNKNPAYVLDEADISVGGNISLDWDEDMVQDLANDAGAPMNFECSLTANLEVKLECDITYGYEDVDVEIPGKVEDNAISAASAPIATVDTTDVDTDIDTDIDTDTVITTNNQASADGLYTLSDYDGLEIFTFAVPAGFNYNLSFSSNTLHFLDGEDGGSMTVECTVPAGIYANYMDDPTDYYTEEADKFEYVEAYETNGNPYGYAIFYREDIDTYYAVFVAEEYTSLVIEYSNWSSDSALAEFEAALSDGF